MGKHRKNKLNYKKKKSKSVIQQITIIFVTLIILIGYLHNIGIITNSDIQKIINDILTITDIEFNTINTLDPDVEYNTDFDPSILTNNKLLTVDNCDLSGSRMSNVKVDIGYGNREYYGYTNQFKQLVYVEAQTLTLQDKSKENLTSTGRYCRDEADVPGVEDPNLDQGHAIADSIGGVANAYNITPQDSTLNRHGQYSDFEQQIREALKKDSLVTDFKCIIIYENQETQTPSSYHVSFKIDNTEYSYYMLNEH